MKPIKSAEEFRALLDRASKRHEQQGLKNVSLKVIQDEGLRVVDGCLLYKKLVDAQKEINAVVEQLTAVTKWNNELYAKIEVANKILNETPQKSLLKFRLRMVLEIPRNELEKPSLYETGDKLPVNRSLNKEGSHDADTLLNGSDSDVAPCSAPKIPRNREQKGVKEI
jgi:hypothetical protein